MSTFTEYVKAYGPSALSDQDRAQACILFFEREMRDKRILTLYFGTRDEDFKPDPNFQNPNNDYGSGSYLTPKLESALCWAAGRKKDPPYGYAYMYTLPIDGLHICQLDKGD